MSNWTSTAREALESYLEKIRATTVVAGGDADEIISDLRGHIEAELAALNLTVVTEQDVQRVISRIGPVPSSNDNPPLIASSVAVKWKQRRALLGTTALFIFGFILPLGTLIFEMSTHACAGMFFDPIPTWFHVFLIAIVPAANVVALNLSDCSTQKLRCLWLANGTAIGVSIFYSLLFLPMSPFAVVGIIFFGIGLLPLSPLCSVVCAFIIKRRLKRQYGESAIKPPRGWAWLVIVPAVVLTIMALPEPLTRYWAESAGSESTTESTRAVKLLRLFGSENVLLKQCYGRSSQFWMGNSRRQSDNSGLAQKVFYRVTGQAYNSVPPPFSKYQKSGRDLFGEFEWDEGLGGDAVAGQVKGLSLSASRLDGICKPEEGWSYVEWILEFKNDHEFNQREARAQIQLPPGGVVSRLTLWVNNEEREAAFAGRGEVREAYQKVAIQQRRDPVLVTTSGPDRVLMQCFPVPPKGGTMKVRVGITIPLSIENTNRLALRLPSFAERNFRIPQKIEHSLWLESSQAVSGKSQNLKWDTSNAHKHGIRGQLSQQELGSSEGTLWFDSPVGTIYAVDRKNKSQAVVKQSVVPIEQKLPGRVAIVLDGSKNMTDFYPEIAKSLAGIPSLPELKVLVAEDELRTIYSSEWRRANTASSAVSKLKGNGGQDNVTALLQAWEWAMAKENGVIIWIHSAQPALLNSIEPLKQRLDWWGIGNTPTIIDVPVESGPNVIAEKLATTTAISALPRYGELTDDLDRLFGVWSRRRAEFRFVREIDGDANLTAEKSESASSHVIRLWASQEIQKLVKAKRMADATKMASLYQLVTPISGAVVLETKQQFDDAGLTPADPATVPSVPEPSTWMLLIVSAIFFWFRWKMNAKNRIKNPLST